MARFREFDPDTALERAMYTFWRHGYSATTMARLVDETGVVRSSLYTTFGNKNALFRRALDRYGEFQASRVVDAEGPLAAVRQWFENAIEGARSRSLPSGCLLINTAAEYSLLDASMRKLIKHHLGLVQQFFRHCVSKGAPTLDATRLASVLLGANVAIYTLARLNAPERQLRAIADAALAPLAH